MLVCIGSVNDTTFGGFISSTMVGCIPVTFFFNEANDARVERDSEAQFACLIHFQLRDWTSRLDFEARHASARLCKKSSHMVPALNSCYRLRYQRPMMELLSPIAVMLEGLVRALAQPVLFPFLSLFSLYGLSFCIPKLTLPISYYALS